MMRLEFRDLKRCQCCGSHVTPEFRRGYGDGDDVVHRCTECDTQERIAKGSAAGVDVDLADPLDQPCRFGVTFDDLPANVQAVADGGEDR